MSTSTDDRTDHPHPDDSDPQPPTREPLAPGPPVRVAVDELAPRATKALGALDAAVRRTSLEPALAELVRARASQINGCAYCVDMHVADARSAGVPERTLHLLPLWRDTGLFTARERAALELTEAVTRLSEAPVDDELFARVAAPFSDQEVADLVWLIAVINTWNRLGATAHPWPLG